MTKQITVISPGPLTLIQDGGRFGFQQLGVSVSGAIDIEALNVGNRLVGNDPDSSALEITLGDAEFEFVQSSVFALTGAETDARLDDVPLLRNVSYTAYPGARIFIGTIRPHQGLRSYLAIAGGVDSLIVLGSRSTHIDSETGGIEGRALNAGDVLKLGEPVGTSRSGRFAAYSGLDSFADCLDIRVILGPQEDQFSEVGIQTFLESPYVVTQQSNRQGLRLSGPEIESSTGGYDIVSDAIVNGSIQVSGDRQPIILLADRQPTGGYPKIAAVVTVDIPALGQATPGTSITFSAVSVEEAQELLVKRSNLLSDLTLDRVVEPISLQIGTQNISVGITEKESSRLAYIDGTTYPFSIE